MVAQLLPRWINIKSALVQRLVLTGVQQYTAHRSPVDTFDAWRWIALVALGATRLANRQMENDCESGNTLPAHCIA